MQEFALVNHNNYHFFKPNEKMYLPHSKAPIRAVDFYQDMVKSRADSKIFILDDKGRIHDHKGRIFAYERKGKLKKAES